MARDTSEIRLDPRVEVRLRAFVFGASPERPEIEVETCNLSVGGALCRSSVPMPLGKPIRLEIDLPHEPGSAHSIVLEAIVVRVSQSGPFIIAFHFVDVPPRVLDILGRFVLGSLPAAAP